MPPTTKKWHGCQSRNPEETDEPMEEGEDQSDYKQDQPITDDDYLAQLVAENQLEDEETEEAEPGVYTPEKILAIAEERDRSPSPDPDVEYDEREGTPSPDMEDNFKRRRLDSSCEQMNNTRRLQQDLRDLRNGLHYLPQRKIGETSTGVAPHIRCTFCNESGKHYSDSCPE
ncbi:hypothetical protein Y032_0015g2691 [Ancylostoma ceylanicum]|uniref:Uncharacterized protein n=1 Tax=Ancylostoma ceylanicum TaxID=53326 RepID=A0A016V8C5_9BILA|nr:hypothetical protein Y032_0015g2691 [Ancylostoma ceylanicum]